MKTLVYRFKLAFKILLYFGFRFKCNNCGFYLRKFHSLSKILPGVSWDLKIYNRFYSSSNFETFNLDNYFCPICWIPDKGRLIIAFLQTLELSSRNLSVLHLSPEIGIQKKLNKLFINCNYRISDYGDESTLNIDIQKAIAFKFDIIICSHILEHVDNDELALRNLYNSLNPNGMVLFLVPLHKEIDYTIQDVNIKSPLEKKETYGLEDHVRQYGTIDFQELLKANFELKIFQVSDLDYHKLGLAKDSRLYIGLRN